ncbi:hypothetical protein F4810DRAFT_677203 [Camillea tinctor]|nr:hypothetical protein F4810DRAFT_677203 [Camillea tinctor]
MPRSAVLLYSHYTFYITRSTLHIAYIPTCIHACRIYSFPFLVPPLPLLYILHIIYVCTHTHIHTTYILYLHK